MVSMVAAAADSWKCGSGSGSGHCVSSAMAAVLVAAGNGGIGGRSPVAAQVGGQLGSGGGSLARGGVGGGGRGAVA